MKQFTRSIRRTVGSCMIAGAMFSTGCATIKVQEPLTQKFGGNDPQQQMEFFHQLADRPIVSYDEGFHALLLFAKSEDTANDYDGRVAAMKGAGMLPASFSRPGDLAVDRGTVAVALSKAMKIRGGAMFTLLPSSPRYATRELQYLSIFPTSTPNQAFSGSELLAVISRAEEYQSVGEKPAVERVPPEMVLKQGVTPDAIGPATMPTTQPDTK